MRKLISFVCMMTCFASIAQNKNLPCSAPEASQFNFWIGDWNLTYNDTLHATNHVEKIMGSCTVQENFHDPNTNYNGKSWSVYNKNYNMWQQTWVDDQGGYIALTGEMHGDSMVLATAEKTVPANISATGKMTNRMVYHNITKDAFDWDWESSTDGGTTWKNNWHIHYTRKNS
ncbi:MAG: hypothetical protein ABJB05_01000 [Parafilimonas sp.]